MFTTIAAAALILAMPVSDASFVAWARGRAVAVDSFRALDRGLGGVRLIGVGESVHEAEPFLSYRLRLLQDLVRRHRVTALVLESGMPEAMALDDYVRGRTATVNFDAVLPAGFGMLVEIRRTMEWLRAWNLGEGRRHPVGVYGADLPARSGSIVPALDRLQERTAGSAEVRALIDAIRPTAAQAAGAWWREAAQKYAALPEDAKARLASDVALLVERVHRASSDPWAQRLAILIRQNESVLRLGMFDPSAPRDLAMAENTLWIVGRLPRGERAVYWAHNTHVQRVPATGPAIPAGSFPTAGTRFAAALGSRYYAIATAYGGPSLDDATAPTSGSVDGTLESVAAKSFLLPLRGGAPAWLSEERPMRFQRGYITLALGKAFDAVAYFERASRAERAGG